MKKITTLILLFLTIISCNNSEPKKIIKAKKSIEVIENDTIEDVNESDDYLDCDDYIKTQTDKMTGNSTVLNRKKLIISTDNGKTGFSFLILVGIGGDTIIMNITAIGGGNCIDDDGKMVVLFRDGTRINLTNDGKFNCKSNYTQYFLDAFGKEDELEMFRTKEIETIRIWKSNNEHVQEDFTEKQSMDIMDTIDCILETME